MFHAGNKVRVISPRPIEQRHRTVIRLDAVLHFCQQQLPQLGRVGKHCLGVGIFRFYLCADVRGQQGWLIHCLFPIFYPEPSVLVGQLYSMMAGDKGPFDGLWRLERKHCILIDAR